MTESKKSWSEEELVSQLESYQTDLENQNITIGQQNQVITDLRSENRKLEVQNENLKSENRKLESEIIRMKEQMQQLLSERSDLLSALQEAKNELQIKSELIVKMKGADLILKENERLKERDRQRENELSEIRRKSEAEVSAAKQDYEDKCNSLISQEEKCKALRQELDDKIKKQDEVIIKGATKAFNKYKIILEKEHEKRIRKSDAKYKAMIAAIQSELWSTVIYAVVITIFMAAKSSCFTENFISFFTGIVNAIQVLLTNALSVGVWCAGITHSIEIYKLRLIIYYLIIIIIVAIICVIPGLIIYFVGKKYLKWYKEEIADHISVWVAVITLAITIFFPEEITSILSINLIWLNIIVHLLYSAGRAYVRGCKRNRGYY